MRYPAARPVAAVERPAQGLPPITPRILIRGITRRWWQILLLWAVGSVACGWYIQTKMFPTYEASALLRVEPVTQALFETTVTTNNFNSYLETQVKLFTSSNVLLAAAADPRIENVGMIRFATDPEATLRSLLVVEILPKSYLIRVAVNCASSIDAANIVNAVVEAYLKADAGWSDDMTRQQIKKLEDYEKELKAQVEEKQRSWLELARKGNVDPVGGAAGAVAADPAADPSPNSRIGITLDEYKRVRGQLFETNVKLAEAEANLKMHLDQLAQVEQQQPRPTEAQIVQEFLNDPEVRPLQAEMERLNEQIRMVGRVARQTDPAETVALKKLQVYKATYDRLWQSKRVEIAGRLSSFNGEVRSGVLDAIRDAEREVATLKSKLDYYQGLLAQIEVTNKDQGTDAVQIQLVRAALDQLEGMQGTVNKRLEQLRFEARGQARVQRISEARPSNRPISDKRPKLLAIAPFAILGALLVLFTFFEVKAGRITSPDDLSRRVSMEVFAVPPLPNARVEPALEGPDSRAMQIADFTNRIDHLRIALCSGVAQGGPGRCVLVTSAVGGEGKTTLAAALAERCAAAGAPTVLIDADLRRATLSELFEMGASPGLSDVLQGRVALEDVLIEAGKVGGCMLLPAGMEEDDPGLILRDIHFGAVIDCLRRTYSIIIIDSPPVLAVPDALILGRWVDGAILSTRHDTSRFSLVEQANKILASAGILVMGAVVNGIRSSASYYGRNAYGTRGSRAAARPAPALAGEGAQPPSQPE